jgi:CRP/FNR family transcriptional regulator
MIARLEQNRRADSGPSNSIRFFSIFSDLSPDEAKVLENIIIKRQFLKDQLILAEEDTSLYMYMVYSGKVRVVKIRDDGKEQIISIHKKGDFFGEMALLDGVTAPATVIAHEDSVIGLLHKNDFEYQLLDHQGIRRKIINILCIRLRDAWRIIKILSFDNAEHRIILTLDRLRELYGVSDDRGVIINMKTTHKHIADYASVSRETATRILNKLEKAGEIGTLENKKFLLKASFFTRAREILL